MSRMQRPRWMVRMKTVSKIRWHSGIIEKLKTKASNFVLDPGLHRNPLKCSEQ